MTGTILRPMAALLLVLCSLHWVACVVRTPPKPIPRLEVGDPNETEIFGVTTVDGDTVTFDSAVKPSVKAGILYARVKGQRFELPVYEIQRYWVRTVSTGKTIALNAVVVGGAILAVALISEVLEDEPEPQPTAQSCPFIYSWNGTRWVFDGEPYGGATTRGLERDDYAELEHLVPEDGEYRILVTNEVPETQHSNVIELIVVDHSPGTRVVADGEGVFHVVRSPIRPREAVDETGRNLTDWLSAEDRLVWEPAPEPGAIENRSEIVLTFPKPKDAARATLVYRVGTGIWGSHMIKSMLELHGSELDVWYTALDSDPAARRALYEWNLREELYTLRVEVERDGKWEYAGTIDGGGPFALESRALAFPVHEPGTTLRIRMRPPKGFWALDAFTVEYEPPEAPISVRRLSPVRATDQKGRDLLSALSASDDAYYTMPTNEDRAELVFKAPPDVSGTERTVFLYARGWYRIHLDESSPPDLETLQRIAEVPGAAARYAAESFKVWRQAAR